MHTGSSSGWKQTRLRESLAQSLLLCLWHRQPVATAVNKTATDRRITQAFLRFRLCSLLACLSSSRYRNPAIAESHHSAERRLLRSGVCCPWLRAAAALLKAASSRTFLVLWTRRLSNSARLLSHSGAFDPSASFVCWLALPCFRLIGFVGRRHALWHVRLFVSFGFAIDKAYCHYWSNKP